MSDGQVTAQPGWGEAARDIWQTWTPKGLFVLRSCLALFTALWIDFRFDLNAADSVMITVFIVSQPVSGKVMEKAYYRLIGTLFGAAGTFTIVILFAQSRTLFMLALALWLGGCTAGSTLFHNAKSYSFVLAGYTSVLFGFYAGLDPNNAIHETIERVTEVCVGILCVGILADGVVPQRMSGRFVSLVREHSVELYRGIANILGGRQSDRERDALYSGLISRVSGFEATRNAVVLENPSYRSRGGRLQRLNFEFMQVSSTLWVLDRKSRRLGYDTPVARALQPFLDEFSRLLETLDQAGSHTPARARELADKLRRMRADWPTRLAQTRAQLPSELHDRFDDAARLLTQLSAEMVNYTRIYATLDRKRPPRRLAKPRYRLSMDWPLALFNGLRATLSLLIACTFWVFGAWPDEAASYAVINAGVYPALLANAPNPAKATDGLMRGIIVSAMAAIPLGLWVLPQVQGYPMLVASLTVFVVPGFIGLTIPKYGGAALGYLITLALSLQLSNQPEFNPEDVINFGVAQVIGVMAAVLAFTILFPGTRMRGWTRGRKRLRLHLLQVCRAPMRGLRFSFESAVRDLMKNQPAAPAAEVTATGLATLELGHGIQQLRRAMSSAGLPADAYPHADQILRGLKQLLKRPEVEAYEQLLTQIQGSIAALTAGSASTDHESMRGLRLALLRIQEILSDDVAYHLFNISGARDHAS